MCEKLFLALRTELLRSAAFKAAFAGILTTVLVFSHFEAAAQSVFKKNSSLPQRPETAVSASTADEKLAFDSINPIGQGIEPAIENDSSALNVATVGGDGAGRPCFDFFGSGRTSFANVTSNGTNLIWQLRSNGTAGAENVLWGRDDVTEFLTPGYFDNDNRADIGVWREMPAAFYYIRRTTAPNTIQGVQWGRTDDIVGREADYDGDGRTDPTVVRRTNAGTWLWFYLRSSNNTLAAVFFGAGNGTPNEDIPLPGADYNGDARADLVVIRQNDAGVDTYFIGDSVTGATLLVQPWGEFSTDFYVTGDYVGDARADFAVWRGAGMGANGAWYIRQNGGTQTVVAPFGIPGAAETRDLALCGDYNGDGKDDIAVYRRSNNTYYWLNSPGFTTANGFLFSGSGGFPVANLPVF